MSDLKTRIGPKVGQEHFPHKSWVRPGYEIKPTKQRTQWHHRKQSEGYGSDVSEHDSDSPRRTPKSNRPASLLTRMGLESPGDREEEERRTPSLLERVGLEPDNRQTDSISVNGSVSPIGETQRKQHKASYAGESIRSQAQGVHVEPKAGSTNKGADLLNQSAVTTENKKTFLDSNDRSLTSQSSVNGSVVEGQNAAQYGHVARQSTERFSDKSSSLRPTANGPPNPLPIPAIPNHLQPNVPSTSNSITFQKTSSQQTISEEGELPNQDMRPQDAPSPEEGEVRSESLPADKVRDLVLPLVLRIAANRATDAERASVPSQSLPAPVNAVALTDEFLTTFAAKGTTEVRKEMRAREGESASSAWRPQATPISRHDSSNDLMAIPMAGPPPVAPEKETGPPALRPTTNIRDAAYAPTYDRHGGHGPPLRYPPTSQAQDFARTPPMNIVSEPSSSRLPETRLEPRAKRPRSRSPPTGPAERYPRRRRSSSRDDGPSTYERPIIHASEYGARSAHEHAYSYSPSKYDRPYRGSGLPHTPPSASRAQYAERMTARSPSPTSRGGMTRSPIRGREIHSPPPASAPVYTQRPYIPREQDYYRTGYSAHYGSEYRDTRYRKPYEQRSRERRRSRTPPRRPSISEQHILSSLRRRSRDRMDVDYNYRSRSRSTECRRGYTSLSPQRPQRQESRQKIPISETPKIDATQLLTNIRLWSAQRGLDRLGIVKWTFEVDAQTATRLGLNTEMENAASLADTPVQKPTKKTSLHLACYPRDPVFKLLEKVNTGQSPSPETSSVNHAWPTFGHLIIKVNEELSGFRGKTWLPDKLGPNSPPIVLDRFVRPGQNVIELVQLSGMDDRVFWLSEQDKPDTPNELSANSHEFASSTNSTTLSELISIEPATVSISQMDDLT